MTRIKFCGLSRQCDIDAVNELNPEYAGFVFFQGSKRNVSAEQAAQLRKSLDPAIKAVGVFVNASPEFILQLVDNGTIDIIQLHGEEDETYIRSLRQLTTVPIIQAFRVRSQQDVVMAQASIADYILLDSGTGSGRMFDWQLIQSIQRPFFLAGGLSALNVGEALNKIKPFAVDVSSGIETDGFKDKRKMAAFAAKVRKEKDE